MGVITAALAGAASWTALEYGLHRFAMHEMRGRGLASREHLHHHADVRYFAPASKKALSAAATTAVALPASWALVGRRRALAYTGGLIGMYYAYEVLHRRVHTHPPRNSYGRWMRRNHLHHHLAPMGNHGVTVDVWDRLFRTRRVPDVVVVPRRMAPDWMLDDTGEVHSEFAADYRVRGRRSIDDAQASTDWDAAFANQPPDPEGLPVSA